jgi:predicted cobalt transporter CbtA
MLRQVWWLGCIASTGLAIYLYASKAKLPLLIAALGLLTLPHLIGAPVAPSLDSTVPAALASAFAANALAVNALFWLLIGSLLGFALRNPNRELFQP